jgi:3-oxoacyl-[acyl-carrier-protein] synthase III
VTNDDLTKIIDTTDEWFKKNRNRGEKTHYQRRRYNHIYGVKAAEIAMNDQV